jgi:hypothetical protein
LKPKSQNLSSLIENSHVFPHSHEQHPGFVANEALPNVDVHVHTLSHQQIEEQEQQQANLRTFFPILTHPSSL